MAGRLGRRGIGGVGGDGGIGGIAEAVSGEAAGGGFGGGDGGMEGVMGRLACESRPVTEHSRDAGSGALTAMAAKRGLGFIRCMM